MTLPILSNPLARRLFLHRHALAEAPTGAAKGADVARLIDRIGFVQVDSINTVERAHHMILFSRRQTYRPEALKPCGSIGRTMPPSCRSAFTRIGSIALPAMLTGCTRTGKAGFVTVMRRNSTPS
jgi:hypothetical protein